ncbi:MAG: hypothetical protein HY296_07150 [Thaumarchaeota archaeon]|nr:hypothetical protein [Nitrososphaerota archaeon]
MKPKCYFCDTDLQVVVHTFKIGPRDEPVCDECFTKTVNRRKAESADGTV